MRVALVTWGTRGDVQPFVAIGASLARRGDEVTLLVPARYVPFVERAGLRALPIAGDPIDALATPAARTALERGGIQGVLEALTRECLGHAEAWSLVFDRELPGADVVVTGGPAPLLAAAVASAHGRPTLCAMSYPVKWDGFPGAALTIAAFYEPWRSLVLGRLGREGRAPVRDVLVEAGVAFVNVWSPALYPSAGAGEPLPIGAPVVPPDVALDPPIDAALSAWIDEGPPPVLVTSGSMPASHPSTSSEAWTAALLARGERVLVVGGGEVACRAERSVAFVVSADLSQLVPRCRAVVHHGGVGTAHTVARASRPSLVCAVLLDQLAWGRALESHGAGVLVRAGARPDQLERALDVVLSSRAAEGAAKLGARMAEEDGNAAVLSAIDALLARSDPAQKGPGGSS